MTSHNAGDESLLTSIIPITDYKSLYDHDNIPVHERTDVVSEEVVEQMADLPDLAGVGIRNPDGDLLCRRLTDTCSWKIPVETVDSEEDFATAITEHVRETIGFTIELDRAEGVWDIHVRTENEEKTASRGFVIFSASPVSGSYDLESVSPEGEPVEDADWFDELPDGADEIPGTNLFFE